VQRGLGHQVDQAGTGEPLTRITDLIAEPERQDAEVTQSRAEVARLASERDAALDEIARLPAALRQMTRQRNTS
jgi:cell division protein FtsB